MHEPDRPCFCQRHRAGQPDAIAAGLKTTVIERGSVVTRGEDCYRAVMESDEGRAEMRIFSATNSPLSSRPASILHRPMGL